MVKIKNVADAAGVSTATVSRVLADKPHVRPEVRKRVMEAVKKLNYQPNRVAQSLRSNTSKNNRPGRRRYRESFFSKSKPSC